MKIIVGFLLFFSLGLAQANSLQEVQKAGVLRHLGVPYANFVTGSGDGLSVELMQGFASYLGVKYKFIPTDWTTAFGDLTGRNARRGKDGAEFLDKTEIKGDVIANGMTILPWRQEVVAFSDPTFPSAVWLIARAESSIQPIKPTGSIEKDIELVKQSMNDKSVFALENTCLDPALYKLSETKANVLLPKEKLKLNEMAPAILNDAAEATLLDVPDALIALEKWPGQIKVIGPVSDNQLMATAFRKDAPELREAFNTYLHEIKQDGSYKKMAEKYYPSVMYYFKEFFQN